ncbi:MAG: ABC transporter permease [Anaerolineae bacterium]|nr:ABC transporter permease [Anaerolineales bacterium]MCQ3975630.1 ABC transporter permease [Anaerolineae bacterium]
MLLRLSNLVFKEFIHIRRDPRTLFIMVVMPLVMLILLGYAATTDIEHLRIAVYDGDKSAQSRSLIEAYRASNSFDIAQYVAREDDLIYLLDHSDVRGALVIPAGYGQRIVAQEKAEVAFLIDGSDATAANTLFSASQSVGQAVSIKLIEQKLGVSVDAMPGVEVRPRVWYNPNLESAYFMIPGMIVMVLFVFTILFTATAIVRERELGTIEQLIVTPIRPIELIVAKVLPYVVISFVVVIEVLAIGVLIFGIPINGSLSLLLGLAALFLLTSLGLGILVSSVATTQQEALLMTFATALPTVYLSGFLFPIEAMPPWLQVITYLVPARYAMVIMRGIILKGVGLEILAEQVAAVLIFSTIVVILAATRFKKKLE